MAFALCSFAARKTRQSITRPLRVQASLECRRRQTPVRRYLDRDGNAHPWSAVFAFCSHFERSHTARGSAKNAVSLGIVLRGLLSEIPGAARLHSPNQTWVGVRTTNGMATSNPTPLQLGAVGALAKTTSIRRISCCHHKNET